MSPLLIKVCGMRDAANIAEVAALRPDYLGLIFVPTSPRYVGTDFDPANLSPLPSTTKRVGVFQESSLTMVTEMVNRYSLDVVQLHGSEDTQYIKAIRAALPHVKILKAVSVSSAERLASLTAVLDHPDMYLLDSGSGGTGTPFDWRSLETYTVEVPFLLAGGIGLHNIEEVVSLRARNPHLKGIDINSRAERAVGVKDTETLRRIFERARP